MVKLYNFKLDDYNDDYYRIYDKTLHVDFNTIPSFVQLKKYVGSQHGNRILDAGCGAGHLLHYLTQDTGGAGYGIDQSETALSLASQRFPDHVYSRQNITAIGFKDASFDRIVCFNVIEHISDQDAVLEEIKRLLKPDGRLIIGTNIRDSTAWFLYQLFIGEHTHIREFSVNEFLDFLGRHFDIIDYQKSSGVFRFPPPASWIFHYILKGDIIAVCRKK